MNTFRVVARAGIGIASLLSLASAFSAAPGVDVNVINQPQVRDADHPARHAFQTHLCTAGWPPGCVAGSGASFIVPANKRLVMEFVSAHCVAQPATETLSNLTVSTLVNGVAVTHNLVPVFMGSTATAKIYAAAQQMRLYADPGTQVSASAGGFPIGQSGCLVGISGTMVDP